MALPVSKGILFNMGIWERLGTVIKSYLNDDDRETFRLSGRDKHSGAERNFHDSDLNAAYEELDDFLKGGDGRKEPPGGFGKSEAGEKTRPVPEDLKKDFQELGLSPDASAAECKAAYKTLLKMYHPDRHAVDPENMKKATEKAARVNAAYERLVKWFQDK